MEKIKTIEDLTISNKSEIPNQDTEFIRCEIYITIPKKRNHVYKFVDCNFICSELSVWNENCKYIRCRFPDLQKVIFEKEFNPFEDCSLNDLNLIFYVSGNFEFPGSTYIRSIQVAKMLKDKVSIVNGSLNHELSPGSLYIQPLDKTYQCKYGDCPDDFLEEYCDVFCVDDVYVEFLDEHIGITENTILTVMTRDIKLEPVILGEVTFQVEDDPFSSAVLLCNEESLHYKGNVPSNWLDQVSLNTLLNLRDIKNIIIDGDVEENAFSGAFLNFDIFEIQGTLKKDAFGPDLFINKRLSVLNLQSPIKSGNIQKLEINSIESEENLNLVANVIILKNSKDVRHISSTRKIVIEETFDEPIDLRSVQRIRWMDFRTVKNPGPYIIQGWSDDNGDYYYSSPSMCFASKILKPIKRAEDFDSFYKKIKHNLNIYFPDYQKEDVDIEIDGIWTSFKLLNINNFEDYEKFKGTLKIYIKDRLVLEIYVKPNENNRIEKLFYLGFGLLAGLTVGYLSITNTNHICDVFHMLNNCDNECYHQLVQDCFHFPDGL